MPNITNIPAPRVPLIDERTGLISREWFRYLNNQFQLTGGGATDITLADLAIAPLTGATAEVAALQTDIQALAVAPPSTPQPAAAYGAFYDMTRHTAAAINTAYPITFNTTDIAAGCYRGSPTSRIYVTAPGTYDFQFSAQLDKTAGGAGLAFIWPRISGAGTGLANSMSHVRIKDNNAEIVAAWNFVLRLGAGDYFELMWAVDSTDIILETFAATAFGPAAPSVILTVTQVAP